MAMLRGLDSFLPLYKSRRRRSDHLVEVETPLFPGRVFCSLGLRNRLPVLTAPVILGMIGAGKQPSAVDPPELAVIGGVALLGRDAQPFHTPGPRQNVNIEAGPLRGIEGGLLQVPEKNRPVVSISLLNRSISAIVEESEPYGCPRSFTSTRPYSVSAT